MGKEDARARITVRVQPRAKATRIAGKMENAYRLQVNAPPVDGKANDACVGFFAEIAGVPKSQVHIVSGLTSRTKVVEVDGIVQQELERKLASGLPTPDLR